MSDSRSQLQGYLSPAHLVELCRLLRRDPVQYAIELAEFVDSLRDGGGSYPLTKQDIQSFVVTLGAQGIEDADASSPYLDRMGEVLLDYKGAPDWIVDGLLRVNGLSIIAAPPKAGKSTMMRWLACNMVCPEGTFFGRALKHGPVLYYCFEDPEIMAEDLFRFRQYLDLTTEQLNGIIRVNRHRAGIDKFVHLGELMEEHKPHLVITDTMNGYLCMAEGTNDYGLVKEKMSQLSGVLRMGKWSSENTHIIMTHHCSKGSYQGRNFDPFQAILGSGAFRGETGCNIVLLRDEKRNRTIWAACEGRQITKIEKGVIEYHGDHMTYSSMADDDDSHDNLCNLVGREIQKADAEGIELNQAGLRDRLGLGHKAIKEVLDFMYENRLIGRKGGRTRYLSLDPATFKPEEDDDDDDQTRET